MEIHSCRLESFGAIERPYHEQVRKTFDVRESSLEFWPDFENALRLGFAPNPFKTSWSFLYGPLTYPIGCIGNIASSLPAFSLVFMWALPRDRHQTRCAVPWDYSHSFVRR